MILGVDVGGTFTDLFLWDGSRIRTAKLPTTADQSEAVLEGAAELVDRVDAFLHGTTAATNALLERTGARTLLVTSPGFEDVIEIGRQDRPSLYDPFADRPEPLVERRNRVSDLSDADLVTCEAVAVSLLRSYEDPSLEQEIGREVARLAPDAAVSLSSDVVAEFREFERTSTTVLNAYLTPVVADYLAGLEDGVRSSGLADAISVMRSSGGLISGSDAVALPASILLSGPAGGVVAAAAIGSALGRDHIIAFDMGGTSTDVCRVQDGRPEISYERAVAGYPCRMPSAAIHTVGAGGGSVGWIDPGGSLRVGPRSAGAEPGPACYGRGGDETTATDANVALGRIAPDASLGGRLTIDRALSEAALADLGEPLGFTVEEVALGIVRVVEEVMAGAIRTVSIEQGADPRDAWLVAFGGAGGLHATALARSLDMAGVIIPPHGGVFSAVGLLLSPPRIDLAQSILLSEGEDPDPEIVRLGSEASRHMPTGTLETLADVRYFGQSHEVTVPYAAGDGWEELADRFHALHRERNGFARPDDPIEVVTIRATVTGSPAIRPENAFSWSPDGEARIGTRTVITSNGPTEASVWRRAGLTVGTMIAGPAVIEEREATTWIGPGEQAIVSHTGALEMTW
ncbi:MAG: hydantoinase/oxoprolinase family protein [Actinomycetota bacterium]|nr:hydantoinase/oxoprolinase family protein [Actinomycetota bacterium]